MDIGLAMGLIGIGIGLVSLAMAYQARVRSAELGRLNAELQSRLQSVSFEDVSVFCDEVRSFLDGWIPDLIYCPDERGIIIAHMLCQKLNISVPLLHGFLVRKTNANLSAFNRDGHYVEKPTKNFIVMLDGRLSNYADCRILIVEDIVITGEVLDIALEHIKSVGFDETHIKSCAMIVCTVAQRNRRMPSVYLRASHTPDVVFPWGRWEN